jgi:hypothetical protein
MSYQHRRPFGIFVLIAATVCAGTLIIARPSMRFGWLGKKRPVVRAENKESDGKGDVKERRPRNLSLQPEAFNLSLRLGRRFEARTRPQSTLVGTLVLGSERRTVQTTRTQTDDGEQIEMRMTGTTDVLTWNKEQGALSSSSRAMGAERELIERLVFDSPDQFVLAQLRGASYYTVGRNVKPAEAGAKYAGPLWNVVRVSEPEPDEAKRPQSRWRLYYINVTTGLIDRIVSEVNGQKLIAEIPNWVDLSGEKVPAQIIWKRAGQTIMQFSLSNFSQTEK